MIGFKGEEEGLYGHAGMLGAAAAVWEDLRSHHILAALLDLPVDQDCTPHLDGSTHESSVSHSESQRHMRWESSAPPPDHDDGGLDQKPGALERGSNNKPCPSGEPPFCLGSAHLWRGYLLASSNASLAELDGFAWSLRLLIVAVCTSAVMCGIAGVALQAGEAYVSEVADTWSYSIVYPEVKSRSRALL